MASVVAGPREYAERLRDHLAWVDPVLLAWVATVAFAFVTAESLDYDMLEGSLRVLFYATLFELAVEIPDQRADTPNLEQLFIILTGSGVIGIGLIVEAVATSISGDMMPAQLVGLSALNSRVYANYAAHEDMSLLESLRGDDYVTHPYTTIGAIAAIVLPLLLKLWIYLFGNDHAPKIRNTNTYFWIVVLAATTGLLVYYLRHGLHIGETVDQPDDRIGTEEVAEAAQTVATEVVDDTLDEEADEAGAAAEESDPSGDPGEVDGADTSDETTGASGPADEGDPARSDDATDESGGG